MLRMGRFQCCRRNYLAIKRSMSVVKRILDMSRMQASGGVEGASHSTGDGYPIGGKSQKYRSNETEVCVYILNPAAGLKYVM